MWKESRLCLKAGISPNSATGADGSPGRVLASHSAEIVVDRLFDGRTQLTKALQPLMQAAERTLQLNKIKRARTVVRVDGRREGVWTM